MHMPFNAEEIFSVKEHNFNELALEIFYYQAMENKVYRHFLECINIEPLAIKRMEDIPFLPVELYKQHGVICGNPPDSLTPYFASSGTTGSIRSKHFYRDVLWYNESLKRGFDLQFSDVGQLKIYALLPGYVENPHASLIYMVKELMQEDQNFFPEDYPRLQKALLEESGPVLLIGVSFSLLRFANGFPASYPDLMVMETGGMKGQEYEITREELHRRLCSGFGVDAICSEYGMTELFSQAYSKQHGIFSCPPWMKVMIRPIDNPFGATANGRSGGINVIDLANVESCSFIATGDIGRKHDDGTFEVLGRMDNSELRGCNLMVQ